MSVVYPANDPTMDQPPPSPGSKALAEASNHPIFAGILILGLALLIGWLVHKVMGGSSSTAAPDNTSDATGQQTLYVPTSNTFENITTETTNNDTTNVTPKEEPLGPPPGPTPTPGSPPGPVPAQPGPTPPPAPTPAPVMYTTKKGDTIEHIYLTLKKEGKSKYGDAGLRNINPNLVDYGLNDPLPAGLKIRIGSGGIGSGGGTATLRTRGGMPEWDEVQNGIPMLNAPGGQVIGLAHYGSSIPLIDPEPQDGWYAADHNGMAAYIHTNDVVGMSQ